jgi:ribosomal RNA-processing protein 12
MEEVLEKIRPHVKSGLANQSGPAKLLVAVEATLKEQEQDGTPVAYYASFLATLQESVKREESSSSGLNLDDGSVVPSTLYLLSLVLPHVPHPIVRSNISSLLNTVAPLFPLILSSAPPLRSAIGIVVAIVEALDAPHLTSSSPLPRQCFATIVELTIDPRPKVRKRAQEAVIRVINSPPPPMLVHPYSRQTADFVIRTLNAVAGNPGQQDSAEMCIWLCTFTKAIASSWPSTVSRAISIYCL